MSRLTLGACLVVGWMLLWGDVGLGTMLGGSVVVSALYVVFPSNRRARPHLVVHPWAIVRLVAYFGRQVVVSNLRLTREVIRRRPGIRSEIVVVPMRTTSPSLLTMVCNLAALTPGTMVVAAVDDPPELTVHVLMFGGRDDPSDAIESIRQLEERSVLAFGTADARAGFLAVRDAGTEVPT